MNKRLPKYMILKNELLSWIESGRLVPGGQVPSENEIAEQFSLSRQTVRQAFSELERQGLLERVQGKGTFVRSAGIREEAAQPRTIGIVTTYISDYIFPHIVRGAEAELRSRGYRLLLASTDNDKEKEMECLRLMLSEPLSGLIIEPTKSAEGNPNLPFYLSMQSRNLPFLMINERYRELEVPCLKVDDELGGSTAARYLIGQGHTRIAGFFKTDDLQGVNRLRGFMHAHREAGIPLLPEHVVTYATGQKGELPLRRVRELLASPNRPTALVAYNDELAVPLMNAARELGLSVPGDVSVVGFDDSALALASGVPLTTLTHPKEEMGREAARRLIAMIESGASGSAVEYEDVVYAPELVERSSAAKPRRG
ncbi:MULTISPECIES: GntR family transcriptional regulator [Saccharibacillus]|uniref:GntR family transcriptional regulator n=1 Tax=Saccharibacillus brassicae TaxID=2583377 RepID=A0A4Y6UXZ3_SACBS|nr:MULTISPECIES: GntR family transcriptional regulator [Saccharibacillus]MWJ33550.1 GntR family transcriptional regulator [Saccharibacillus sp. WB 17]QDH22613.1 GntR family transcriptional regulator [Saccharibacillus brassicae]